MIVAGWVLAVGAPEAVRGEFGRARFDGKAGNVMVGEADLQSLTLLLNVFRSSDNPDMNGWS